MPDRFQDAQRTILDFISARESNLLEFTRDLVATSSPTPPGDERAMAQRIQQEIESLHLGTLANMKIEVEAKREAISKRKREIADFQEELGAPGISAEHKRSVEAKLDRAQKSLDLSQLVLDTLQKSVAQRTQTKGVARASGWMASRWKLNQSLYREYGGRIIFQQFGWEPIDAYRKLLDSYKDAGKFKILDPRFDGAVYRYFEHRFVYADDAMAEFYFEKPWWERTEQEMISSGFK